jgi:DNA primase
MVVCNVSELHEIKKKIYNEQKIEEVLALLECWHIETEQNGKLFVAGLPDGDNERSVQVKNNESLTSNIRSKGINGDIYDVISYIVYEADTEEKRKDTLPKSKFWLCQKLNYVEFIDEFYKETSGSVEKPKYNQWLHKINKCKERKRIENTTISQHEFAHFGVIPYKKWLEDGLSIKTQKYFQVGIDVKTERITFLIHNRQGSCIGVKGRYCGKDKTIEDKYKYLYLVPCNKSIEFFNFHRALPHIKQSKEVVIVEGAKTVMYLHQWGYKNVISIEGDSLSDEQICILKELGLGIKFIFAWDKDKDVVFIANEVKRLTGRLKYSIFDKDDLLSHKDSPSDKGEVVWAKLYNDHQYKINK